MEDTDKFTKILIAVVRIEEAIKGMEGRFASGSRRFEKLEATQKEILLAAAEDAKRITVLEIDQTAVNKVVTGVVERIDTDIRPMHWAYGLMKYVGALILGGGIAYLIKGKGP